MLTITLTAFFAVFLIADAVPTPTNRDTGPIGELPKNWDRADDQQSLFKNKLDKSDPEPYPLALSEEGNSEGYDQDVSQRYDGPSDGVLDNVIMSSGYYAEPPAMEGLSAGYDSRRRKRGSGTKVGGAGAATKVATKNGSGKKNLKPEEHDSPVESASHDHEGHRSKRGSGTKVGGAAASAKTATKNSGGNKKNFRPMLERRKRDSGLSAADVRALLNLWEAQERRKQEQQWTDNQWSDRYYGRVNSIEEDQPEVDENGDVWYNEPVVLNSHEREYPHHSSYFSEQNRMALARGYPDVYPVDPAELAQRYEEARRKRVYANKMKRFMVARKRSDGLARQPASYRPRDDLYTLAELLRTAPRVQDEDIPVYRRLIL